MKRESKLCAIGKHHNTSKVGRLRQPLPFAFSRVLGLLARAFASRGGALSGLGGGANLVGTHKEGVLFGDYRCEFGLWGNFDSRVCRCGRAR